MATRTVNYTSGEKSLSQSGTEVQFFGWKQTQGSLYN